MSRRRIAVVGTMSADPYAGMAWMCMQMVAGLHRLGHDAYYVEVSATWPYDPVRRTRVCDSDYALPYLKRVMDSFGMGGKWAYRRSFLDGEWFGLSRAKAEELLLNADAVLSVTGAMRFSKDELRVGRLVYYGTDPVYHELMYANRDERTRAIIDQHDEAVTYGENIGVPGCRIPPLPNLRAHTRQPILLDQWTPGQLRRNTYTTVGNWKQDGRDVLYEGDTFLWSKHHEFLKFIDLPKRTSVELELATNLSDPATIQHGPEDVVRALGMEGDAYSLLSNCGWKLVAGSDFSTNPWKYRDYIRSSRAEFTVARDLNARLRSGWFSERSACYLAAGCPVVTQDTGFGTVLPTGEGLFAFNTLDEILAALDAIESDYVRHSAAARDIAEEYFRAETVMAKLVADLGL